MSDKAVEDGSAHAEVGAATHFFLIICIAALLAFGAWAYTGKLDVVSMATGEVVPSSQLKSIQHLEGGIVREILVKEGDRVKPGQSLVVLEPTSSGADVDELKVSITALRVEIARLEAEATGKKTPTFEQDLVAGYPVLVRRAIDLFKARGMRQRNRLASQREAVVQRQQDIREITARINKQRKGLALLKKRIAISDELLKEHLTNEFVHLGLLQEANDREGRIEEDGAALKRAKAALKEARSEFEAVAITFDEEARQELEEKRRRLNELNQRFRKFADSLERTVLHSPVEGVVKTIYVFTRGGVVRPGGTVLDIIPLEDKLIIEAMLPTQDIGYVRSGQMATIKLASADAVRFGSLEGTVSQVSPDTLQTKDGMPFYKVRIETSRSFFQRGELKYHLFPGMQVATSIHTGQRTVFQYLVAPFLYSMDAAMQER